MLVFPSFNAPGIEIAGSRMSKQPNRRKSDKKQAENRRADSITVAWTLSVMTTLGAQLFAGIAALVASLLEEAAAMHLLARLLIVSAAIAGLLSMGILPLVYRAQARRPPPPIIAAGLLIAAVPIVVIVWLLR